MRRVAVLAVALGLAAAAPAGADERSRLTEEVNEARAALTEKDPSLAAEISRAAGYALFPGVGKGAMGIGAARGTGQVVVKGNHVAKVTLTQVTIGFQLGGQKYVELILFENESVLRDFMDDSFTMAAQVSAVAAASGAAANAKYTNAVKVITMAVGGLMYEASVGGQKFNVSRY
ncbi:MAG: YSC84-related protein [Vicinamibacterales bacterium]